MVIALLFAFGPILITEQGKIQTIRFIQAMTVKNENPCVSNLPRIDGPIK